MTLYFPANEQCYELLYLLRPSNDEISLCRCDIKKFWNRVFDRYFLLNNFKTLSYLLDIKREDKQQSLCYKSTPNVI